MVLIDTSIWIRFLDGRGNYTDELDRLLAFEQVAGHDLIYGELLVGDRGGRAAHLTQYLCIPQAMTVPHSEVVEFVRSRKLQGRGLGWIDMHLLASVLVSRFKLWTADARLQVVAKELEVAYESPA